MYIFLAVTFPPPPHCNLYIIFEEYITSKCVKKKGKGKKKSNKNRCCFTKKKEFYVKKNKIYYI